MNASRDHRRSDCPISIGLETFGDAWSLLIIRDLLFKGKHTYNEFLNSEERIATNILGDRLRRLEIRGIIEHAQNPTDARKTVYWLTEKGFALAPVLIEMVLWAAEHEKTAAPENEVNAMRNFRSRVLKDLKNRWEKSRLKSPTLDKRTTKQKRQ